MSRMMPSRIAARTIAVDPLAAVCERLAHIEQRLERLERPRGSNADDVVFVAAIARAVRGCVFSAHELRAHARVDAELAQAMGSCSSRHVGKRLRRLSGQAIGGFTIVRVGRDAAGTVWALQVVEDLHGDPRVSSAGAV